MIFVCYPRENMKKKLTDNEGQFLKKRIKVEHAFSWLTQYRRIAFRFERTIKSFTSFCYLAMTNTLSGKLKGDPFQKKNSKNNLRDGTLCCFRNYLTNKTKILFNFSHYNAEIFSFQ